MAYEAHKWKIGEEITSDKLNHIEEGIAAGGDIQIDIQNPQDGDTLQYSAAEGKWINVAQGGGTTEPLIANATIDENYDATLDKTWKEIRDAFYAYTPVYVACNDSHYETFTRVTCVEHNSEYGNYSVKFQSGFTEGGLYTTSENGYPST